MSISTEIIRIKDNIRMAYISVAEKGGTIAVLYVTAAEGSDVVIEKDSIPEYGSYSEEENKWVFIVPEQGTWTAIATKDGESVSRQINIGEKGIFNLDLNISLSGISIATQPTKVKYKPGETLDLAGLVVKANYSDGTSETITDYTTNPAAGAVLTEGNTNVIVSYKGHTASFNISVKSVPTDVSFANATPAEFLQIAQALQSGEISVSDLTNGWDVGATKSVSLSAFTSYPSGSASTQAAQTATLVILHKQSNGVCAGKQFSDGKIPSFIIGFKDNVCKSYYHDSSNKYESSLLFTVENNIYNALPTEYKQAFGKQFKAITGVYSNSSTRTDNRNMCSPAEAELFGKRTYCIQAEFNALTASAQFDYYKTQNNRKHTNISNYWWERSPNCYDDYGACYVNSDGTADDDFVDYTNGLAPFGCI